MSPTVLPSQVLPHGLQVTGILLCFFLLMGYLFALPYPKGSQFLAKHFRRLSKALRNFEVFYITHIVMSFTVLVLLIIHPYPGNLKDFGNGPRVKHPDKGTPWEGSTWIYLLAGTLVYLLERIARYFKYPPPPPLLTSSLCFVQLM